jgi:hypothetical protein
VVVAEVVRIWRSLEPPGRFLVSTEPAMSTFPMHDIGDNDARKRTAKLLMGVDYSNSKQQDDITASTAGSSTVSRQEHTHEPRIRRVANVAGHGGECFGGSFRGLILSLFSRNKDSIMNQYLP